MLEHCQFFITNTKTKISFPTYTSYINKLSSRSLAILNKVEAAKNIPEQKHGCYYITRILDKFPLDIEHIAALSFNDLYTYIEALIESNQEILTVLQKTLPTKNIFIKDVTSEILFGKSLSSMYYYKYDEKNLIKSTPLKCIYNDSQEYTLDTSEGQLIYSTSYTPTKAVFILDIFLLLMSWYSYIRKQYRAKKEANLEIDINMSEFYKNYVFLPFVYHNQNNIIIQLLKDYILLVYIDKATGISFTPELVIKKTHYKYVTESKSKLLISIKRRYTELKENNITPAQFLDSLPSFILEGDNSILDDIHILSSYKSIIEEKEYNYLIDIFKNYHYLLFLYDLYELQHSTRAFVQFNRRLYSVINRFAREKVWSYIQNKEISILLKEYLCKEFLNQTK